MFAVRGQNLNFAHVVGRVACQKTKIGRVEAVEKSYTQDTPTPGCRKGGPPLGLFFFNQNPWLGGSSILTPEPTF
jgi:hypothetical protein